MTDRKPPRSRPKMGHTKAQTKDSPSQGDRGDAQGVLTLFLGLATGAAERYAAARKDRIVDAVMDIAATMRRSGRQFEGEQDWLADAIDRGATKVRDRAEAFRDTELIEILSQGRVFARERPKSFLACTAVAGLVAATLLQRAIGERRRPRPAQAA